MWRTFCLRESLLSPSLPFLSLARERVIKGDQGFENDIRISAKQCILMRNKRTGERGRETRREKRCILLDFVW